MIKEDIIEKVVAKSGLQRKEATKAFETIVECISHAIIKQETIFIRGFATIIPYKTKPKKGRNFTTGEIIPLQSQAQVKFKLSKSIKNKVL